MRYAVTERNKQNNLSSDFPTFKYPSVYLPQPQTPNLLLRRVRINVIRRLRLHRLLGLRRRVRVRIGVLIAALARKQSRQIRRDLIILGLGLSRCGWRRRRRRRRRWRTSRTLRLTGSFRRSLLRLRRNAAQHRRSGEILRWRPRERTVAGWKSCSAGRCA
jgi:hypothetical protein